MTTEMKMETRSLASLRPAEYNPRVQLQPADPEYQNIKEGCKSREVGGEPMMNQYEIMAEILRGVRSDE